MKFGGLHSKCGNVTGEGNACIATEINILHNVSGLQPRTRTKNLLTDLMGARRRKR